MKPAGTDPIHIPTAAARGRDGLAWARSIAVCLAAASLILAASIAAAAADPPPRFILFNAEYNSSLKQVSKTTVFLEKRLFKLDTETGETWVLIDVLQDGRDIRYWQKITDTPRK